MKWLPPWLDHLGLLLLGRSSNHCYSSINKDETVILFNTHGWLNEHTRQWHIPIHGWIVEPSNSTIRRTIMSYLLRRLYNIRASDDHERAVFKQRSNLLFGDNERRERIIISLNGKRYTMGLSTANGHFFGDIVVDESALNQTRSQTRVQYRVELQATDTRVFEGQSELIRPQGLSVISDIDDTIKQSLVTHKAALLEHTFYKDFMAVPGMAKHYGKLVADQRAAIHLVSSSPWQLYTPLAELVTKAGFPWASFSLKWVRFKDQTLLNLFKPGMETKPKQITAILKRYPKRQFLLYGDSGENDPEVYSLLAQRYPKQIIGIYIRNVTGEQFNNPRFTKLFNKVTQPWQLFDTPEELS